MAVFSLSLLVLAGVSLLCASFFRQKDRRRDTLVLKFPSVPQFSECGIRGLNLDCTHGKGGALLTELSHQSLTLFCLIVSDVVPGTN